MLIEDKGAFQVTKQMPTCSEQVTSIFLVGIESFSRRSPWYIIHNRPGMRASDVVDMSKH